ncbi:MAG: DUF6524 family protein [Gammaproteobacteria bacterium]|nr:DUF6524 family protein [Gammaproteobacteria bacterium]MDH5735150.1 DUF6524 family protein [Gammaproteobacteria bacterium]
MTEHRFTWKSFWLRLGFALILVYATYNPSGYSFFHWAEDVIFGENTDLTPAFAMFGVVLLIGWTVYIRATLRSLGPFGLFLAFAFFATLVWWLVYIGLLGIDNISIFTYLVLFILAAILATGMSWSHIRRRMSGQADVDEIEG